MCWPPVELASGGDDAMDATKAVFVAVYLLKNKFCSDAWFEKPADGEMFRRFQMLPMFSRMTGLFHDFNKSTTQFWCGFAMFNYRTFQDSLSMHLPINELGHWTVPKNMHLALGLIQDHVCTCYPAPVEDSSPCRKCGRMSLPKSFLDTPNLALAALTGKVDLLIPAVEKFITTKKDIERWSEGIEYEAIELLAFILGISGHLEELQRFLEAYPSANNGMFWKMLTEIAAVSGSESVVKMGLETVGRGQPFGTRKENQNAKPWEIDPDKDSTLLDDEANANLIRASLMSKDRRALHYLLRWRAGIEHEVGQLSEHDQLRILETIPMETREKWLRAFCRAGLGEALEFLMKIPILDPYLFDGEILREAVRKQMRTTVNTLIRWEMEDLDKRNLGIGSDMSYNLRRCAEYGWVDTVKLLFDHRQAIIAKGIRDSSRVVNVYDYNEEALRFAAKKGHLEMVKLLLEHGANPGACEGRAVVDAAHLGSGEMVRLLLMNGRVQRKVLKEIWEVATGEGKRGVVRVLEDVAVAERFQKSGGMGFLALTH
ncbi:hypothetical protein HDU97_005455 [Phlyctochytrium planicorne]|nr:hypothetical protein HDU97_005455 [Phlyctochytrium planicorne]